MGFLRSVRPRLLIALALLVAGYFAYTAAIGAIRANDLDDDRAQAAREVAELEQKKAHLEAIRAYVASDAYVEQQARRQLGWVRDGEIPFVVISPPSKQDEQRAGTWWERLFPR